MMEALFLPQQGLSDCVFPGTRSPELEPPRRRSAGARRNDEAEDCPARHMGGALKAFQVILHRYMYLGGKMEAAGPREEAANGTFQPKTLDALPGKAVRYG